MKTIVYTTAFGNDCQLPAKTNGDGTEHICFVDDERKAPDGWQTIQVKCDGDYRSLSKKYKINPELCLDDHDFSVWVDTSINLSVSPVELVDLMRKQEAELALFSHFQRTCVYKEADEIGLLGLDDQQTLANWLKTLFDAGYPPNTGLHDSSVLVRSRTENMSAFNTLWYELFQTSMSTRDQLSLDVALWYTKLNHINIPGATRKPLSRPTRSGTNLLQFVERPNRAKVDRPWLY